MIGVDIMKVNWMLNVPNMHEQQRIHDMRILHDQHDGTVSFQLIS